MDILLNGRKINIINNTTLIDIINKYHLENQRIAIEVNNEIVPKSRYFEFVLKDNDKVEIIKAVGGG